MQFLEEGVVKMSLYDTKNWTIVLKNCDKKHDALETYK